LPANFPVPIVIAQHISVGFEQGMADWLNGIVSLNIKIAQHTELLQPGTVYISPADKHLSISADFYTNLRPSRDEHIYHPSADILLSSVADSFGKQAVGIICTGMGSDGAAGMAAINGAGGLTLAQDKASSVIFGMNQGSS
jgi:two-component system chemotaxis response regulator CheB